MRGYAFALLLLSQFLLGQAVLAHGFSRSVSNWRLVGDKVVVNFSAPLIVAESVPFGNRNQTPAQRFETHLRQSIGITAEDKRCQRTGNKAHVVGSKIFATMEFDCGGAKNLRIELHSFFDSDPSHIHFARFYLNNKSNEYIFSSTLRKRAINFDEVATTNSNRKTFFSYTALGVQHILEGLDHLAFLVALLLVCGFRRALVWAITGFTLGHSLTLGFASSGLLLANIPMIEALIGWTILLMALERSGLMNNNFSFVMTAQAGALFLCLLLSFFVPSKLTTLAFLGLIVFSLCWAFLIKDETHAKRLVPILSIGFGLIHGLGFAAVLEDIGVPSNYFLTALLGFNLGVEIGQLLFVACLWGLVYALYRVQNKVFFAPQVQQGLASLLVGLGTYWFIGRNFF